MVKIIIENNVRGRIDGKLDAYVKHELDRTLSYYADGYQFSPRFKRKMWDGRVRLFSKATQVFQTGCFFIISQILQKHQIEFCIEDKRVQVSSGECLPVYGKEIRDYQEEAIKALLGKARGILLAATGAGKTFIIANVVARLNLPTVIYTHTCDLLHQMKDEIEGMLKIECGQLGDGIVNIRRINVATMQTVSRALLGKYEKEDDEDVADDFETDIEPYKDRIAKMVKECNVAIVDETHHASASSIQAIMNASEKAYYRYGVTATLREKGDDLLIHSVLGRIVYTVRASELIKKGWLVRPTIYFYEVENDLKAQEGTYRQVYKTCIVENDYRNRLILDSALKFFRGGKKILILVRQIDHGTMLARELDKDMQVCFLQSKVNSIVRKQILTDFKEGRLDCLIATQLADEGLDIPILDAVILAGSGKSKIKAFQRIGRAIRKFPGKDKAYIVDFMDKAHYLEKHSEERLKIYQTEEEFIIKIQKKS